MKERLLVTFDLPLEVRRILEAAFHVSYAAAEFRLQPEVALDIVQGHSMMLVSATRDRLDATLIARLPDSIRAIATYSVGHDHVDLQAARARGIAVFSTPDVLSTACAEVGMLLLLGAARRVTESVALLRSGNWKGLLRTSSTARVCRARCWGFSGWVASAGRSPAVRAALT